VGEAPAAEVEAEELVDDVTIVDDDIDSKDNKKVKEYKYKRN